MLRPIIQGGMGVYISTPFLAKTVSENQGLGTVTGVAGERVLARILQMGDPGGHFRRALGHFPFPEFANQVIDTYFVEGGIAKDASFRAVPTFSLTPSSQLIALTVCASFAMVFLAKEGHSNPISINYLEKIQPPHIFHFVGAMLAGIDFITMGAGIPIQVPGVLDTIANNGVPSYRVQVDESKDGFVTMSFNPRQFFGKQLPEMRRPDFLPIVSSSLLAEILLSRSSGSIEGFVVETPLAGGHNAPPRGQFKLNEKGEPIYGSRDEVDFNKLRKIGKPFWIGGSYASPQGLAKAKSEGAIGIQVGSIFALSEDSGMEKNTRAKIRCLGFQGKLSVRTDIYASPTGFPFKVVELPGTMSEGSVYESRERICDLSGLVTPYVRPDQTIGYRCPSEPVPDFVKKGGEESATNKARCLCNGLLSASGLGSPGELPIFTLGDNTGFLRHLMRNEGSSYTAKDALAYLLSQP